MTPAATLLKAARGSQLPVNYFNYFTEIEDHFRRARKTGMFLLSPLDWALIEVWKDSGVPLEAVHKGIDRAFEKWHVRKRRTRLVNSVAYCSQEVLSAAREMSGESEPQSRKAQAAFSDGELAEYFGTNARLVRQAAESADGAVAVVFLEAAESLEKLARACEEGESPDLEPVEQRLTVLEERLIAAVTQRLDEDSMLAARQEMDRALAPYRGKMTVEQLSLLEKQFLQRKCFEGAGLPRLSLFYLK